jgi:hypothetical protein
MLEITITVQPTNATGFYRETYSETETGGGTYFDDFTANGSRLSSREAEVSSGSAVTTASGADNLDGGSTTTFDLGDVETLVSNLFGSAYTTESWNGAFTYSGNDNGTNKNIVGAAVTENVLQQTTTSASFTFLGRTTTTVTSSALSATYSNSIQTISSQTTVSTTTLAELTHSRKTTTETEESRVVAYTATDSAASVSYAREPQYEFATVLVPQENEVLWVLTGSNDGIISQVGTSYTNQTTIYPVKEFFEAGVYGSTYDPSAGSGASTTTTYASSSQNAASGLRPYAGILPAAVSTVNLFGLGAQSGTFTAQFFSQANGLTQQSTRTISKPIAQNIAGSLYTTTQATTATTSQWEPTYFITNSESFSTSGSTSDVAGTDSGGETTQSGNTAEGQWSRASAYFYQANPRLPTEAGRSYRAGWFALNSATSAASLVSANGMTISIPTTLRANQLVAGVWPTTWSYVSNSSSVTASAWGGGVSATSISSGSAASATTTSGTWIANGSAATEATSKFVRAVDGGVQKTGTATILAGEGTYYTFNSFGGSGTQVFNGSSTTGGYKGILTAENMLRGGPIRYTAAQRNYTALPT